MKKLFYFIFTILLFLPVLVKADMGAPIIKEYKASVINPSGAIIYEYDEEYIATEEKIAYGTEVYIEDELEFSKGFITVNKGNPEENYVIKFKDVSLLVKNYKVNKNELTDKEEALVLKDVKIKKGPADGYDNTGTIIKKGTKINIQWFKDPDEKETNPKEGIYDSDNPWVYVEYNGTKGFVNTYGGTIAFREIKEEMITNHNVNITDSSNKVLGTIKTNTIVTSGIYLLDQWSSAYYINYNGVSGYINEFDLVTKNTETEFTALKRINIYEEAGANKYENLKAIGNISKGDKFASSFYNMDFSCNVYYEKNNIKGWIYIEPDEDGSCGLSYLENEEKNEDNNKQSPDIKEESKSSSSLLYTCIGSAIIISLTAIVIITFINKKRKRSSN